MHSHHNGLKTAGLFGLIWVVLLGMGAIVASYTGSNAFILLFAAIGLVTTFWSYWNSDKIAIRAMHARPVTEAEAPEMYRIVRELSEKANQPMPKLFISPTDAPNAFATGRNPQHAAVCCTEGILRLLDERELRGVLGHELMHVYNRDILTGSVAAAIAGVISTVGQMLSFGMLATSPAVLDGVIDDLDAGMRRQFEENFVKIQTEFDKAFRQLFGGGHGKLELVEGEDILEAGVRIIAQPPGKKLQNMILLSGGEKAFVAIALYFAILKVHPTPFCIMDEIEAALDEANVVRTARYMRTLADKTQFIVITHRRGTMEGADVLYGVTMQEQGVSKILTINLNDMAKELKIK